MSVPFSCWWVQVVIFVSLSAEIIQHKVSCWWGQVVNFYDILPQSHNKFRFRLVNFSQNMSF